METKTLNQLTDERLTLEAKLEQAIAEEWDDDALAELFQVEFENFEAMGEKIQGYYDVRLRKIMEAERLRSDADLYQAEADKIRKRQRAAERDVERLESNLMASMLTLGIDKIQTPRSNLIKIQEVGGKPPVVPIVPLDQMPERFVRRKIKITTTLDRLDNEAISALNVLEEKLGMAFVQEQEFDKSAAKAALEAGDPEAERVCTLEPKKKKLAFK